MSGCIPLHILIAICEHPIIKRHHFFLFLFQSSGTPPQPPFWDLDLDLRVRLLSFAYIAFNWRIAIRFVNARFEKHLRVFFTHTLYPLFCFRTTKGMFFFVCMFILLSNIIYAPDICYATTQYKP
jgi:hypothetical protein